MKSDLVLLTECLESELEDETREAFAGMLGDIESGKWRKLTKRQREWVEGVHGRLGLDPGTENLVSSGAVKPTAAERAALASTLASLGPKPLKPPTRRSA
jgi:hypothetical protein